MDNFQTINIELNGPSVTLWLARPEVHNALNNKMIHEISSFFSQLEEIEEVRFVVIRGHGKSFCSGADLQWMKNAFHLSNEENLKESEALSKMFASIYHSSKVVTAMVHGNVFGGGNGLVAVCDIAYGVSNSCFSFSETKIGMVAATIAPYMLLKMRSTNLKELIYSARGFDGAEAVRLGLLNQSFATIDAMERYVNEFLLQMEANGKEAIQASKQLINKLNMHQMSEELEKIPALLAHIRVSAEAQEGFSAFLEKRKANWQDN